MMLRIYSFMAMVAAPLTSCTPTVGSPTVDAVTPNWGFNGESTSVVVSGENFFPGIDASGTDVVAYDRDFQVLLVGMDGRPLSGVRQESSRSLAATVPAGVAEGWYGIEVVSPSGLSARLDDAFEVTNTRADNLRLTVDQSSVAVNEMAILEFSLRAPDGQIVQESVPLRITVSDPTNSPHPVEFDLSGIVDGGVVSATEAKGDLGIDGSGFIGVTSQRPTQLWVTVEATIRDRVTVSATRLVTFSAGETEQLVLELVDPTDTYIAGDAVNLAMRLVDIDGNTVSGVTATIALQETCMGGEYESTHTFVDDATLQVFPTRACTANRIRAFGVVEGIAIEGRSPPFEVVAADTAGLRVEARPDRVAAGIEAAEVTVGPIDLYGNPSAGPIGTPVVAIDGVEVSLTAELGEYTCVEAAESSVRCEVRLFDAEDDRVLDVETSLGLRGASNPFDVVAGPGFELSLLMASGTPTAGDPYAAWLTMQDEFGNRIALEDEEISGVVFEDAHGPIDCLHTGTALTDRTYSYQCVFERAGPGNTLYASSPTLGVMGSIGTFSVEPGRLSSVVITRDESIATYRAGDLMTLALEGFDPFGNRVVGEDPLDLVNVAGGLLADETVLTDGVASEVVQVTRAMLGDSVWAIRGFDVLGGTPSFSVEPGPVASLVAQPEQYWAYVGAPIALHLTVMDTYGNAVPHPGGETVIESAVPGATPQSGGWLPGVPVHYVPSDPVAGDILTVRLDGLTATVGPIDVGGDCDDFTVPAVISTGPEGRLCIAGEGSIDVTFDGPPELLVAAQLNDSVPVRGLSPSVSLDVSEHDNGIVRTLVMEPGGCAAFDSQPFWAGRPGAAVGPIELAAADSTVTGGTESELSRTELTVAAKTCTGDPASDLEIHLTTSAGALNGDGVSVFGPTGFGNALTIGSDGEAGVELSVESFLFGGSLSVQASGERALGRTTVPVMGDSVPPRIRSVSPRGRHLGPLEQIVIQFTEAMLMDPVTAVLDGWVQIESEGASVPIDSVVFRDPQTIEVTLTSGELESGTILVTDGFRDASGNRLDGDNDGFPGGEWTTAVGLVPDGSPALTTCAASLPRFRPDGDDGPAMEADRVRIEVMSTDEAARLQWSIIREDGTWFETRELAIGRSDAASFEWNGRGADGQIVPAGMYLVDVAALDEAGNIGTGCSVSVEVVTGWFDGGE